MNNPTEQELAGLEEILQRLAVSLGDQQAWECLYRSLWPWVLANMYRMLRGHRQFAEDASQDVFLRLLRYCHFDNLKQPAAFKNYLYMVCQNVARDCFSRLNVSADQIGAEKSEPHSASGLAMVELERVAIQSMRAKEILGMLDEQDRLLLTMVAEGFDLKEISQRLGLSYVNAGVRLHRIRGRLRERLEKQ